MNVQPRTREERHQFKHKETLEKHRLKARTGNFYRYEDVENPIRVMEDSPSYLDGWDRMVSGGETISERNMMDREKEAAHQINIIETRRAETLAREEERWKCIDSKEKGDIERIRKLQEDPLMGKKNLSGQPFNIVNSKYDDTPEGEELKYKDRLTKYRGELRTVNLAVRGHLGFNPITGEQVHTCKIPERPQRDAT